MTAWQPFAIALATARGGATRRARRQFAGRLALLGALLAAFHGSAAAQTVAPGETLEQTICRLIETSAREKALPVSFFTRLIWRESSFRPGVTSRAGAQGIAQFMPGTAEEQGLDDPFDPETAIPASAAYLSSLRQRFGNLGLAAAAYNAGPTRLARWIGSGGYLPVETEDYVVFITGRPVSEWQAGDAAKLEAAIETTDCATVVASVRKSAPRQLYDGVYAPYGVQLSGNFSKSRAIASYERQLARFPALLEGRPTLVLGSRAPGRGRRAFYRVRLPAETMKEASAFCRELRRAGGSCIVLRN